MIPETTNSGMTRSKFAPRFYLFLAALLFLASALNSFAADASVQVQLDVKKAGPRAVEDLTERGILRDYRLAWAEHGPGIRVQHLRSPGRTFLRRSQALAARNRHQPAAIRIEPAAISIRITNWMRSSILPRATLSSCTIPRNIISRFSTAAKPSTTRMSPCITSFS